MDGHGFCAFCVDKCLKINDRTPSFVCAFLYVLRKGDLAGTRRVQFGILGSFDGGVPEWLKGAGCKPADVRLRWFESNSLHHFGQAEND